MQSLPLRTLQTFLVSAVLASASTLLPAQLQNEPIMHSTLANKVLWGYQGWFGPSPVVSPQYGFAHWSRDESPPSVSNAVFDAFPDFSEYSKDALTDASPGLTYANGTQVKVYSATKGNGSSVATHFEWMQKYGIDGVFLQRFVTEIETFSGPRYMFRNAVLSEVALHAVQTGRAWAIEWDITGTGSSTAQLENTLSDDFVKNIQNFTRQKNYLHQDGKPVVVIFGFGFVGNAYPSDPAASINAIRNLQIAYNLYVVGGVPFYWRAGSQDSRQNFQKVYETFDALLPWSVGRYDSIDAFDTLFEQVTIPDRAWTAQRNMSYAPVIWPGFSWANLQRDSAKFNAIPRLGGKFFNAQAASLAKRLAPQADFIFGAMFDEWNEGTAIAKIAPTKADVPAQGCCWLYANIDNSAGSLESDHYLKLAGALAKSFAEEAR